MFYLSCSVSCRSSAQGTLHSFAPLNYNTRSARHRSHSVVVSTQDLESCNPGSNPGGSENFAQRRFIYGHASSVLFHLPPHCSHSVVVSTQDFESCNPGSNPGGSVCFPRPRLLPKPLHSFLVFMRSPWPAQVPSLG